MLRGVNVGGHNRIRMDALRTLYASLQLREAATCVQSGNVVFRTDARNPAQLTMRIENGIEKTFGFRPVVVVRSVAEMRDVIAGNPFAARRDIDPARYLVLFLSAQPGPEARDKLARIRCDPDELRIGGRELYIYYPNGLARPKLPWTAIEKTLQVAGTGRNWNTVVKLLEMAESLAA